jgi:hypothetical protein
LDAAVELTQQLTAEVSEADADLDQVWAASEDALRQLRAAGYSPDEFLPDDVSAQLNFNVPGGDLARRFYRAYAREVRKAVCGADEDLRGNINNALTAGAGALLTVLAGALAVPAAAVVLLAPIGAVLLIKGVDALCAMEPAAEQSRGD